MKHSGAWLLVTLVLGWTAVRLAERWRQERLDRNVALLCDWQEIRDLAARQNPPDKELLARLKESGISGLLLGAETFEERLNGGHDIRIDPRLSQRLIARGVRLARPAGSWRHLKDLEVGFNPGILARTGERGLGLALRLNHDPWMSSQELFTEFQSDLARLPWSAVLFNSDEVPGGPAATESWTAFLTSKGIVELLFEFRPAKSAVRLAKSFPALSYRAHTIPSAELKDLSDAQERSRWRRAVEERSCRFLLLHTSIEDTLQGYLDRASMLRNDLTSRGWQMRWPLPRVYWTSSSILQNGVAPWLALVVAMIAPVLSLKLIASLTPSRQTSGDRGSKGEGWSVVGSFFLLSIVTLAGACVVAAIAQCPETRLQLTPFRGIKLAFLASWVGSFLVLYRREEIERGLSKNVRRIDAMLGVAFVGVIVYLFIRSGNAGVEWKAGWEQIARDSMEDFFIARPRFKEFAIGHPLMLLGLYLRRRARQTSGGRVAPVLGDGRLWIGIGMIGQVSIINTFCHLHSPLSLAFLRSLNGIALGILFGVTLIAVASFALQRARRLEGLPSRGASMRDGHRSFENGRRR